MQVALQVGMVEQLKKVAQSSGSSLFATVLAAFKVLLRRFSGRDDLIVGTPSSGRGRPDLEGNLVGCFVNLVPLRTNMAGTPYLDAAVKTLFPDPHYSLELVGGRGDLILGPPAVRLATQKEICPHGLLESHTLLSWSSKQGRCE